ncbi:MAG: hotdog fold thioesterase [Bacteroidota bacterium]|nr:hotdog fold thioesterase [Bacteroidota bacterium]
MKNIGIPARVVAKMMEEDHFSRWLGITVKSLSAGACSLEMTVRKEMLNGFGIAHGGIAFSVADSALAFASNSRNRKSLVINTSVSFTSTVKEGDVLLAVAEEVNLTNRLGIYQVVVSRQDGTKVLVFTGTVYRKDDLWFPGEE